MERRGHKPLIKVPSFKEDGAAAPGSEIDMDSRLFGMGVNCLQATFECTDLEQATYLHDSLVPLAPILSALGAATPIFRGRLTGWDFRWNVLSMANDVRTPLERETGSIPKSRYSSINHYISDHPNFSDPELDDAPPLPYRDEHLDALLEQGVPESLAKHVARLVCHDAMIIYKSRTSMSEGSGPESMEHFEQFNSTNWNSIRFKPPPSLDSSIGYRVEFRSLDLQMTDYENAAFCTYLKLIVSLLTSDSSVNTAMPISMVDENMDKAHSIDAIHQEKFWWPKDLHSSSECGSSTGSDSSVS